MFAVVTQANSQGNMTNEAFPSRETEHAGAEGRSSPVSGSERAQLGATLLACMNLDAIAIAVSVWNGISSSQQNDSFRDILPQVRMWFFFWQ